MTRTRLHPEARIAAAIVVLTAGLALALRMYDAGDKSIWLDEAWSWRAAKLSLPDMVEWTAADRHPPLYYAMLHYVVAIFGDGEFALRLLSVLASAGTAALLAFVGYRSGGWLLGAIAGLLLVVHPTHIEFAQEARMYPLMGLLVLASTVSLAAVIERPSLTRAFAYGGLLTAMLYTHYSAALVVGLHLVLVSSFAFVRRDDGGRRIAAYGLIAMAAAVIAFVPWMGNFLESAREGVGHLPEASWRLADLVGAAMFGLQRAEGFWLAIALPLIAFGAYGVVRRARDPYVVSVAAIAVLPTVQFTITFFRTPVLDARQASPFIAGVVFVCAIGLLEMGQYLADVLSRSTARRPVAIAGSAVLAVVMLLGVRDWYRSGPREDWREAARIVEERGGTTLVWRGYADVPLRYYTDVRTVPASPAMSEVEPDARSLILSHHTADEKRLIIQNINAMAVFGEPVVLQGIEIYPLTARTTLLPKSDGTQASGEITAR